MTALLLCWYAFGLVACGLNFALLDKYMRAPVFFCIVFGPGIIAYVAGMHVGYAIARAVPQIDESQQYLWKKKP